MTRVLWHRSAGTVGRGLGGPEIGVARAQPTGPPTVARIRTGAVASTHAHPLAQIVRSGVPVTLASDDPGVFECDLVGEYRVAHEQCGPTPAELIRIARTGIDAAFCSEELAASMYAELDAVTVLPTQ